MAPNPRASRCVKVYADLLRKTIRLLTNVKPASVNRELACLKFMFSLAKKWKLVDENPVKEVKLFQEQKIEMHILDKDETDRLIHCSAHHLKPILIVALNTGMRKGEILNLRWNDIDFDRYFIFIRETKSGRSRKVPMNYLVLEALNSLKRESEYVFYNPETKKRIKDVKTAFKAACRRAGIKDLRFHDLRHTAATYMVTGGVDLVTVAEILGHTDIKMTMRYAHPTPENKRKAVNVLNAIFNHQNKEMEIDQRREFSLRDIYGYGH
jgi:integrase